MNELIVLNNGVYVLDEHITKDLILLEKEEEVIKLKKDQIKQAILEEMEKQGIKQIDDKINGMKITYVASTQKEKFNSKQLREDNPSLYDSYIEFTDVKSSLRVTIK